MVHSDYHLCQVLLTQYGIHFCWEVGYSSRCCQGSERIWIWHPGPILVVEMWKFLLSSLAQQQQWGLQLEESLGPKVAIIDEQQVELVQVLLGQQERYLYSCCMLHQLLRH
jgi:hypothetical protein